MHLLNLQGDTQDIEAGARLLSAHLDFELSECDAYAAELGIEMIPCIQTLGHVEQILKWDNVSALRDTSEIFLVGEPETYRMLEAMIRAASDPMRSRRIHIGMDEAHRLGLGSYLARHGYRGRFQVMNEHLSRVLEISEGRWT